MSQTGYTPISLYYSTTASAAPTAGNLVAGELAINTQDGVLYYKDAAGVVQKLATKGGVGTSSTTQVLYNNAGLIAGSSNMTFNGTTLTTANDASISGLTVGKGNGSLSQNTVVGSGLGSTTGNANCAFGVASLRDNTTGNGGCSFGYASLVQNTTGIGNSAYGYSSLFGNTTGGSNSAFGYQALQSNTTGSSNTAIGYQAGYNNTGVGAANNFFGSQAGLANTTGQYNIYIGNNAADNLQTGSNGIYIGRGVQASSTSVSQEFVMGVVGATGKGTNTGFISPNGGGVYQGNNSATWSITSDARLKKNIVDNTTGLNAISQIQVRNFEYRTKDEVTELPVSSAIDIKGVQLGAIAQELQAILPDCVKTESTGVMSVDATNLTWYLINAVKELNAKITALENK